MNHVGKEMAENFLRDRRARSSATATMEYETVKEMYTDLRGGLSPEGRISLAGSRCGYVCDRFEFTQDGAEIFTYLTAARAHSGIFPFLWGVPDGQASMYIGKGLEGRAGE